MQRNLENHFNINLRNQIELTEVTERDKLQIYILGSACNINFALSNNMFTFPIHHGVYDV